MAACAEEPVQFSHKRHAPLKIECRYCHTTVETGEKASFPAVGKCMACHRTVKKDSREIERLAGLGNDATPFPARQIYTVKDFVFFSHARHRKADIECASCHGAVIKQDIIRKELPTSMKYCVDCHKARRAAVECNICHELGQ